MISMRVYQDDETASVIFRLYIGWIITTKWLDYHHQVVDLQYHFDLIGL
jgi:hypothetical protein